MTQSRQHHFFHRPLMFSAQLFFLSASLNLSTVKLTLVSFHSCLFHLCFLHHQSQCLCRTQTPYPKNLHSHSAARGAVPTFRAHTGLLCSEVESEGVSESVLCLNVILETEADSLTSLSVQRFGPDWFIYLFIRLMWSNNFGDPLLQN